MVEFYNADVNFRLPNKTRLKKFIPFLFENEGFELNSLTYIFCSDDYLLEINQRHLQHDDYTDIITFDLSETDSITGEIYISIERVKENAEMYNSSFETECLRVIFHGALHLCGYKDRITKQQVEIRMKEDEYIELYLLRQ